METVGPVDRDVCANRMEKILQNKNKWGKFIIKARILNFLVKHLKHINIKLKTFKFSISLSVSE